MLGEVPQMKKVIYLLIVLVWFTIDMRNTLIVNRLQRENRVLMTNNVNLVLLNQALSKGVSDIADKLIEKAKWDEQVAAKFREFDSLMKGLYGQTNQEVSGAVR